jgi:pimeloyl-ACP methyl ester carboxylesterase
VLIIVGSACNSGAALAAEAIASQPPLNESFADLPAGRIYYQDSGGKGAAVVFLHAGSGNSRVFENQIAAIRKAGFRFIAYDRAGAGRSTRAVVSEAATRSESAATTPELEQLMDYLQVQRFHIVGVAAGGGIGLHYALSRPQRVLSITVSNSIGNVQDASYTEIGRRIRPAAFNALPPEMQELGPSYRAANPEGVARWLQLSGRDTQATAAPGAAPRADGPPPDAARAGGPPADAPRTGGPPPGGGGAAVTFAALEQFTVPTLLLTGDADMYTPPSVLRLFKAHMKKAELYIIAESGHAAHWENPAEFNARLIAFLRKH